MHAAKAPDPGTRSGHVHLKVSNLAFAPPSTPRTMFTRRLDLRDLLSASEPV